MYRLYNPNSGEHFYTASVTERNNLINKGWKNEGVGWIAPTSGSPVYRLYNPNAGEHLYTLSAEEKNNLIKVGWKDEGTGWYSGGNIPIYRVYNSNAYSNNHHYTNNANEKNSLVSKGWQDEGIAWYGTTNEKVAAGANGIDVSEHQKDINWSQAKNAGVRFAMLRVGWGHAGNGAVDKKFYRNYTNSKAAGIPIGVYVYSYADDANEAVQEANYALSILNGRALDLPICIDLEDEKTTGKHSKAEITAMAKAFCERIKQAGYTPMIYANRTWLQTKIDYNQIKQYRIWYAQYPYANSKTKTMWTTWNAAIKPAYSNHVDIWQFTSHGQVNGINGNVDLNRSIAAF